jgi:hypothetical protein
MGSAQQTVTAPDASIVSGQIANATLALPSGLTVVGNTGIGTTSPDEILHLKTTADADLGLKVENDDTQAFVKVQSGGTALYGGNGGVNFVSGGSFATAMNIDANGHITKPLQSAFSAYMSATQSNFAINGGVTILFDTERFDQNADFNTSTYTFTAPVTGRYQLNLQARLNALDTAANYYQLIFKTSNTDYIFTFDPNLSADADYYSISFSILADMDASDTAYVQVNQSGGSQQTDINHGGDTYFSGYLVA